MDPIVLEILDGDRAGDVVPLGSTTFRIGRKPGNDLVLADEKTSGVHAEIVLEGDRYVLRDLGSTNGTFLDGRRVTELVLGSGDTFVIGRVRVRFVGGGPAAAPEGDALQVGRLDTTRLAKSSSSRSVTLLAVLLLAAGGAGGYLWWQSQERRQDDGSGARGPRPVLVAAGNKVTGSLASCEDEQGWNLRAGGQAFQIDGRAHTGTGAFAAERPEGAEAHGFALATFAEPLIVLPGRTVTAAAFVQTTGNARAAVRLWFGSSTDTSPLQFRTGTRLQAAEGWTELRTSAVVPPGTDRVRVEVVAVLPEAAAAVRFDDVALLEGGEAAKVVDAKVESAGASAIGTGQAFGIRAGDQATLFAVAPGAVDAALHGLAEAGLLCLSDVGGELAIETDADSCHLVVREIPRIELVFPADNAAGTMALGDEAFDGVAASSTFAGRAVLLGDRTTRCLVQPPAAGEFTGQLGGGRYRLLLPGNTCRLQLGFRTERETARELLRTATQEARGGEPGKALDRLREVRRSYPHDAETLALAQELRAQLLDELAAKLRSIGADLDEAVFFETRGGFERVIAAIDALQARYGVHNLPDAAGATAMRTQAAERLAAIDAQRAADQRQRLEAMAAAFADAQQGPLAEVVRNYIEQHLKGN